MHTRLSRAIPSCLLSITVVSAIASAAEEAAKRAPLDPEAMARSVTIHRDAWGTPHIEAPTDAACAFGLGYAQAEDFAWQIEETYIRCIGRAAEVFGPKELNSDLLNRAFEVVATAKQDIETLDRPTRELFEGFIAGLNRYLAKNPNFKPRLITHYEPWMALAYARHLMIEMGFGHSHVSRRFMPHNHDEVWQQHVGSNAWAIGPSRTKNKTTMLLVNPHQPWYGFGQFYEAHVKSGEGWNMTGATFFGHPMISLGHNEHCGWAFTSSDPDTADAWLVAFDDPSQPLRYRHGDQYRMAVEWKDSVTIKSPSGIEKRNYTFQKTHHGPVISQEKDGRRLVVQIARMREAFFARQLLYMARAKNLKDFRAAMGRLEFQMFNAIYADKHGDIYYLYNGAIPRRDPSFNWSRPVDGNDPRTDWKGYHPIDELPQITNPPCGYVQNCNSTPFYTCDDGNPFLADFPDYMVDEKYDDKRRAKMSRLLLRNMKDVTLEQFEKSAFDTTLYWPLNERPNFIADLAMLKKVDSPLAAKVEPYLAHLIDWDCKTSATSTQATLCVAWYQELYGMGYPAERLERKYVENPKLKYEALVKAAQTLQQMHGSWKVPYGEIHRLQRHANVSDFFKIPFDDRKPSVPTIGAPGPLGIIFTQYFTPSVRVPFLKEMRRQYGVVGNSYLSVIEFGEKVTAKSVMAYGASNDPASPHFFDQAKLVSEQRMKPQWFYWDDVVANAKRAYHP